LPPLFFEHPILWWTGLEGAERWAVLAVVLGVCTILVAAWIGVRRWWLRWKRESPPDPL
jgi:hypothetical protein